MKSKKYDVKIYFSGFCSYMVDAANKDEAIAEARNLPIKKDELLCNLENWPNADDAEVISND